MSDTTTEIEFWIDPACPFCWATARWVVDEVVPHRDITVTWRSISLLFKNDPPEGSEYWTAAAQTHGHLRVMEAIRAAADSPEQGNHDVFKLYWELGARLHHDGNRDFEVAEALEAVGLDTSFASAATDEQWDPVIRAAMDDGLGLVGNDVGTPIIAMTNSHGERVGYFGPVITKIPTGDDSLKMWDALVAMMDVDGFFELKKTRTEGPNPGARPEPV